jgi:FKBP-type peptidyl-prolyl cis-trans isomerase
MIVAALSCPGCKPRYKQQDNPAVSAYPEQESIYRSNQLMIKQDIKSIRDRAAAKGWKLTETGTGVFYQIISTKRHAPLIKIGQGDRVELTYKLSLLDGTECYSSVNLGPKQFIVDKSEAELGLHETIKLLSPGDSALIVIPPYRAFGLSGDGDRIPPRSILVYEIRIDSVARH